MYKHLATLLAATAIAACSSDARSLVEPTAPTGPIAQEYPAPAPLIEPFDDASAPPVEPFEQAFAPPPAPLPPRASEPPYPHPGAPSIRSARAGLCDVAVERTRNGVMLTALADPDRSMSGHYSFIITKSGGGNSSDIEQGGPFRSSSPGVIELSSSEISMERGSGYRATLTLTSQGREVCRRTVRS
jgi:hypothetical protein